MVCTVHLHESLFSLPQELLNILFSLIALVLQSVFKFELQNMSKTPVIVKYEDNMEKTMVLQLAVSKRLLCLFFRLARS